MASTYLSRTQSTNTNSTFFVFSTWIKFSGTGNYGIVGNGSSSSDYAYLALAPNGTLNYREVNGGVAYTLTTNRVFRDVNAWYHIYIQVDLTQATASNRIKIYINNEAVTYSSASYPPQNYSSRMKSTGTNWNRVGAFYDGSTTYYLNGLMSHVHYIDGSDSDYDVYTPSTFGEYDANGVWKIKTSPSVTYGNNGFFILKNGNSVTDQSGNGNNFTVAGGTLTNTEDCPSNVFATCNPLIPGTDFLSGGNNTATSSSAFWRTGYGTLAVNSGKWYFEAKQSASGNAVDMGICEVSQIVKDIYPGATSRSWGYHNNNVIYNNGGTLANVSTYTTGDIISIALDLDNNYVYFAKNGVWQNSGDPTSGASGTGGFAVTSGYDYTFCIGDYNNSSPQANFGNGYFGTTAVASAGTNASGNGIFEYDVPSGYTALSTKGLNL